jgi:hypothetical protein
MGGDEGDEGLDEGNGFVGSLEHLPIGCDQWLARDFRHESSISSAGRLWEVHRNRKGAASTYRSAEESEGSGFNLP